MRHLTDVIPAPAEATPDPAAAFRLRTDTVIRTTPGSAAARRGIDEHVPARQVGEHLAALLRPATGFPLPVEDHPGTGEGTGRGAVAGAVSLLLDGADGVGEQGYRLDIGADAVTLRAATAAGLFAGVQTLRQLLPAEIDADRVQHREWVLPGGRIVDRPRFAYRGAMLDLARHHFTPDEIKAYLDGIAQFKINHLHLHLTDDQGWRIEIDGWPRLTDVGGGPGTGVDGAGAGFLTKAQYADVIGYAAQRFITIVPEIDMPGHTNAAQSAYPELNRDGRALPPRTDRAVGYSSLCIDDERTYAFVEDVIRQVAALTPGDYLHLGGDEAWVTTDADYRTFMTRVLPLVARYGKRAIGWQEVAKAEPDPAVIAQFWRPGADADAVTAAAARGNRIIMSPADRCYLDMKYDPQTRLGLDWAGFIDVETAYDWDPATHLPGVAEESVLGVEAPLWSETLRSLADVQTMAFPRLPAIAEVGWSPRSGHDWPDFRRRLAAFGPRWDRQGVSFHRCPTIAWLG